MILTALSWEALTSAQVLVGSDASADWHPSTELFISSTFMISAPWLHWRVHDYCHHASKVTLTRLCPWRRAHQIPQTSQQSRLHGAGLWGRSALYLPCLAFSSYHWALNPARPVSKPSSTPSSTTTPSTKASPATATATPHVANASSTNSAWRAYPSTTSTTTAPPAPQVCTWRGKPSPTAPPTASWSSASRRCSPAAWGLSSKTEKTRRAQQTRWWRRRGASRTRQGRHSCSAMRAGSTWSNTAPKRETSQK